MENVKVGLETFKNDINRSGTSAVQVETPILRYKKSDMISLVIADFDFEAPGPIVSALEQRID